VKIFVSSKSKGNEVTFNKPKGFWNKFRLVEPGILAAVIISCVLVVSCSTPGDKTTAGGDKSTGRPRTLTEVAVFIELEKPSGDPRGINRDQIQNDIEMKLRQAGINVVPQTRTSYSSGLPIIYVNVTIAKFEAMYAYNADIICINTSSKQASAKSGKGAIGTSGLVPEVSQVRSKVADLVNRFIRDYLLV
jgi:hypothetical protein